MDRNTVYGQLEKWQDEENRVRERLSSSRYIEIERKTVLHERSLRDHSFEELVELEKKHLKELSDIRELIRTRYGIDIKVINKVSKTPRNTVAKENLEKYKERHRY